MVEVKVSDDVLLEEVYIAESLLVATLWKKPILYTTYNSEKLTTKHFGNKIWKFYFGLGREMYNRGTQVFDDIVVNVLIKELNSEKLFKKFGEYETIEELMLAVDGSEDNVEVYFEEVKKYSLLRGLKSLLGKQVIQNTKKYKYKEMTRHEIESYWNEQMMEIQMSNGDTKIKEYNLVDNLETLVDKLNSNENLGIPFYNLKKFSSIMNGWAKGTVYLMSAFSGMGKSSFVVFAIIMSFIKQKKKLIIIANEMDIDAYQKMLLISVMGSPLHEKLYEKYKKVFNRSILDRGEFSDDDKERINEAIKWIKENVEDKNLIKFIPIEHYTMQSVEQILRFYKQKGYDYAVVDTAKPSDSSGGKKERWVQFVEDFEIIYKLAKKDVLDMGIFCTVQNADSYINVKFLDYSCIGDGKKIKNTVDFCSHIRLMFDTEKFGENALKVYEKYDREGHWKGNPIKLDPKRNYYLVFVSKNRRGMTNSSSVLPVLVIEVDLNTNKWKEIGWTRVVNESQ